MSLRSFAVVVAFAALAVFAWRIKALRTSAPHASLLNSEKAARRAPTPPASPQKAEQPPRFEQAAPVAMLQAASPAPADERTLMAALRALGPADAVQAIALAREGNARFPTSPDAAERAWLIVKSLDGLGRFHEAREEARTMVQRYAGSPWAEDVERHTLVYPLDQPSREQRQAALPEPEGGP